MGCRSGYLNCFCVLTSLLSILLYEISDPVGAAASTTNGVEEPAIRIVRFRIDYPKADLGQISKLPNWPTIMRKSVLASLKFVNKHWAICSDAGHLDKSSSDCGKLQVTGEAAKDSHYLVNATFIGNRDPVKNTKVDATSTVFGVVQIGLKGGIFQYTNAMKILGKPSNQLDFEEGYFCYPGYALTDKDRCRRTHGLRKHRALKISLT